MSTNSQVTNTKILANSSNGIFVRLTQRGFVSQNNRFPPSVAMVIDAAAAFVGPGDWSECCTYCYHRSPPIKSLRAFVLYPLTFFVTQC